MLGGFLGQAEGWRWLEGLMGIFAGVCLLFGTALIPETYAPVLLRRRAEQLSKLTGKAYISTLDAGKPPVSLPGKLKIALTRPWVLLFREPIVLVSSIYISIIYGTLYLNFAAYPIVFQELRGWSVGIGGLAFTGTAIGVVVATLTSILDNKHYVLKQSEAKGNALPPESRLYPAIVGSIFIPTGLFWFAWTCGPNIHWAIPIVGSAFFSCGLVMVFMSLLNYLIDSCKCSQVRRSLGTFSLILFARTRCRLCSLRHRRQLRASFLVWSSIPTIHAKNVRQLRNPLGWVNPCIFGPGVCSISDSVLQVRQPHPYEVQVHRRSRTDSAENAGSIRVHHRG